MTLKRIVRTVLFYSFFLSAISVIASEVVEIKPAIEVKESTTENISVYDPLFPYEEGSRKNKKGFFKRWKEKAAKKKLSKFLQSFQLPADTLKCDIITTLDGEEIEAKVLEVNTGAVLYKLCDQQGDGPRRTLLNSKVLMIKYADGYKEVFKNNRDRTGSERQVQRTERKTNTWAIGFLLGILLGVLGILIAYLIYLEEPYYRRKAVSGALIGVLAIVFLVFFLLRDL